MALSYSIVIPSLFRPGLSVLLQALIDGDGPAPKEVIVVDDRPISSGNDMLPAAPFPVRVIRAGGKGPAAARNLGWQAAESEWIAFLDDDVIPEVGWRAALERDLDGLKPQVAGSQARIVVPAPTGRRMTDSERATAALQDSAWITADMAYRRSALLRTGGFDSRFRRAYREDADLALRVRNAGFTLTRGNRTSLHPIHKTSFFRSVRAQAGNADDALMRHKHGKAWRQSAECMPGTLPWHVVTCASLAVAALGRGRLRRRALTGWALLTGRFALRRIVPGPASAREIAEMVVTSVAIPPAAVAARISGELRVRTSGRNVPDAVLFDRDDTLIVDVPYNTDPELVRPVDNAPELLANLRARGVPIGIVTNQAGVGSGRITPDQLVAVNERVEKLLGPFATWQICTHAADHGCECRKPEPGSIIAAARAIGTDPSRCVMIGDTGADVNAALAAGARAILIPTERTRAEEIEFAREHAQVASDLRTAIGMVTV